MRHRITKSGAFRLAWTLFTALLLVLAAAPTVMAGGEAGGDFGKCGSDYWIKFEWQGSGWNVEWPPDHMDFTDLPVIEITDENDDHEPVAVSWTHLDADLEWIVDAVWIKTGKIGEDEFFHGPFDGGTSGTAQTEGKGISFVLFCFRPMEYGELMVEKLVEPEDVEFDGVFEFELGCDLPENGLVIDEQFSLPEGGMFGWIFDELIPEIYIGADCWLKETTTLGAEVAYLIGDEVLVPDEDGYVAFPLGLDLTLTVVNTFPEEPEPFEVNVTKEVVPTGYVGDAEFGFAVECVNENGAGGDTFTLAEGETSVHVADPDEIGDVCTVVEYDTQDAVRTYFLLDGEDITLPEEATVGEGDDEYTGPAGQFTVTGEDQLVVVVNEYDEPEPEPAEVSVTKIVTDPSGVWNGEEFELVLSQDGVDTTFTLDDLEVADFDVDAGTVVTLVETDDQDAEATVMTVSVGGAAATTYTSGTEMVVAEGETYAFVIENIWLEVAPSVVDLAAIEVVKTANPTIVSYDGTGPNSEVVTYTFVITNTGVAPLVTITLVDDHLGAIAIPAAELPLLAGDSITVTATYTATAADVGKTITNIATVTGTTADNRTVTDTDDAKVDVVEVKGESKTLPATGAPALPLLLLLGLTSLLGGAVVTRRTR
jgi:hypothetical protein